jgi:DNA-directed RNA polymerase subunit RPC12/RpoP
MTGKGMWIGIAGVLAIAIVGGVVLLSGCNGGGGKQVSLPKARAYYCEDCKATFGVPLSLPVREQIYPPIVCPLCGKRSAVEAYYYMPKGAAEDAKPVLYSLVKYGDDQIKAFESYIRALPADDSPAEAPEVALAPETPGGFHMYVKYAGDDKWLKSWGDSPQTKAPQAENAEKREKFKSIFPVFDSEWTVYPRDQLKQWYGPSARAAAEAFCPCIRGRPGVH